MVQVIYKRKTNNKKDQKENSVRKKAHRQVCLEAKGKKQEKKNTRIKRARIINKLRNLGVRFSYNDYTYELERILFQEQRKREIEKIKKELRKRDIRFDYRCDFKKLKELYTQQKIKETKQKLLEMNVAFSDNYDLNKLKNLLSEARNRELLLDQVKKRKIQPTIGTVAPTYFDDK